MINFIIWIVLGAIIGWVASMIMNRNAQQGLLMDIIVGIVGAFLGGFIVSLFTGDAGTINQSDFSISGLLVSLIGAIVLLAIVNLIRRGSVR